MAVVPLRYDKQMLTIELPSGNWLVDTGSAHTLGSCGRLEIEGLCRFDVEDDPEVLRAMRSYHGLDIVGIVGSGILNQFDLVFDEPAGTLELKQEQIQVFGDVVPLSRDGQARLDVMVDGRRYDMVLDTASRLSYFMGDGWDDMPDSGEYEFYHPMLGKHMVETRMVTYILSGIPVTLRTGRLVGQLLETFDTYVGGSGVIGCGLFAGRRIGYFARRNQLVL